MNRLTTRGAAAALALAGACISGCGIVDPDARRQMADSESIIAPFTRNQSPAEAAAWAADPYDADKRARGMNALANAPFGGAEAYTKLYRERLADPNAPVRATAARAVGLHGSPDDVPRMLPLTRQSEMIVRLESTRALQRLHNRAAIPALLDRLNIDKENDPEIRAEAASALGQYAENAALQGLIAALADQSLLVNRNAHESLKTLTGQDNLAPERKVWVAWLKATDKPFAAQRPYVYPVFWREKRWIDYVPLMPAVPNERASTPVGFSLENRPVETKPASENGG